MLDVGGSGGRLHQTEQIEVAADIFVLVFGAQLFGESYEVYRLIAFGQSQHRFKDIAVGVTVEIFRLEDFRRFLNGRALNQHRTQNGLLGFQVLRRDTVKRYEAIYRHGDPLQRTARLAIRLAIKEGALTP